MCSFLFLVYSRGHHSPTHVLLLCSIFFFNILPYWLFYLYPTREDGFSFLSIYGQPFPTFLFPLVPLLFDVPCLINSQTLRMISQVASFLYTDKQGTPEEGQRIQCPKHCVLNYLNKDEDNSVKNHNQNNQAPSQKFRQIILRSWFWKCSPFSLCQFFCDRNIIYLVGWLGFMTYQPL